MATHEQSVIAVLPTKLPPPQYKSPLEPGGHLFPACRTR